MPTYMAKTDSFFIRARCEFNGTTYNQISVDTGAYVDALGKSVLRIHRLAVSYGDALQNPGTPPGNVTACAGFQLTTQSQASMVNLDDKSVIASGKLMYNQTAAGTDFISDQLDVSPQSWRNGYLVGVEQLYLAVDQTSITDFSAVSIVLECTVETLSQSAAMALALSQQ